MADVSLKLSAKDIYEKDFEKTMARGYRREEVDDIITDYQKMADMNNEVVRLSEENNKLKKEVEELRIRVATSRPSDNKSFASSNSKSANNNVDILKRISNLEKAVFGK